MTARGAIVLWGTMLAAAMLPTAATGVKEPAKPNGDPPRPAAASAKLASCWAVDDVRPGMKGHGLSVFKGTKIERFEVEVLGVLKNTNPGRDLVIVRLSGCNLEKTGVIAGMSGSPVYIDDKLLGAVGYAWQYGKEPIAGVTPFSQMADFVEVFERRNLAQKQAAQKFRLPQPIQLGAETFETVTVGPREPGTRVAAADGMWLAPLQTPLAASGFTAHSLNLLQERGRWTGTVPVQVGAASAHVLKETKELALEPGAPLAVSLVQGDFDLSGIGTVTHIDGDRVYGFGHPFMSLGQCDLPLMSAYVHTVNPRLTVSFKMGSPLHCLGVIDADVSTCVAGWMGRKPDLLPVKMTVQREDEGRVRVFHCQIVRHKSLMPQLLFTVLTNSVDMEGDLPEELTAEMTARVEFEEELPPLVIRDTFSGSSYAGGRAPSSLYSLVASMVQVLTTHHFKPVRIKKVEVETRLFAGRSSAEIDAVQLDRDCYAPGDTLKVQVFLKPFKGERRSVTVNLKLPDDLPEGNYTAVVCDQASAVRMNIRDNPNLSMPSRREHVLESLRQQTDAKRTHLAVRVAVNHVGVALDGQVLPQLPPSMVEMLSNSKRTGGQTFSSSISSSEPTEWVIHGVQPVKFTVTKNKKITMER